MKLNISYPSFGTQKVIEIDEEAKLRCLMDKRMSAIVNGDEIDAQFKGYEFKISGGNDKQGFPMKQGILVPGRVRLLFSKGHSCFRERRKGQRKRKSVRGCIVSPDIAVINLVVVKKGDEEIVGLTDEEWPRRLGPKRASKIRKLFGLSKEDDVRDYVVRREFTRKNGKKNFKTPKIQRLVTKLTKQRARRRKAIKKKKFERSANAAKQYAELLKMRRGSK